MIISFVGFMGSGKTTISNTLSKKYNIPIVSTDKQIEMITQKKIKDIFDEYGEEYFRELEYKTISNIIEGFNDNSKKLILDLGGGAFIQKKNRILLKDKALTIFLDVPFKELCKFLSNKRDNRPLLQKENWISEAKKLYEYRKPFYIEADKTIKMESNDTFNFFAKKVLKFIQSLQGFSN